MTDEVLFQRGTTLVRRPQLAPGEALPWHRDPFQRVAVVLRGDALAIEYRDGGESYFQRRKTMEVFEAVRTVLAVRNYQDKAVPSDVVQRIVEAGRLTASSMNGQPWHFIVVENRDTLRQLGALIRTGPYIAQAPLAVVVAIEKTPYAVSDGSRAIQAMILTAWSAGVGSNWAGFLGMTEVKSLLGIPAELDVLAIVPFGYPAQPIGQGKKQRKSLSEVAHRERFGQPFA